MLKEILLKEEINVIASNHTSALKIFSTLFNKQKSKKKYKLLYPLKLAGFNLSEAKMFNFKAGEKMWKNCDNNLKRNNGGRPKIVKKVVDEINDHMKGLSSVAANRYLIKLKTNASYREGTYKDAYNKFFLKNNISFSTFKNKLCKRFKKPHRLSDLCDYCEYGKVRINLIISYVHLGKILKWTILYFVSLKKRKRNFLSQRKFGKCKIRDNIQNEF